MSLTKLFEAMVEEESEHVARERHERQVHRPAPAPSPKDIAQDHRIRSLERENQMLKLYVTGLVDVLLRRKVIDTSDVDLVVAEAAQAAAIARRAIVPSHAQ